MILATYLISQRTTACIRAVAPSAIETLVQVPFLERFAAALRSEADNPRWHAACCSSVRQQVVNIGQPGSVPHALGEEL
jgi:hypothetical protein